MYPLMVENHIVAIGPCKITTCSVGMTDGLEIKVCSLNCWGLYTSPDRLERFQLIGEYLSESDFDVIGLQEVWIRSDYDRLVEQLAAKYPYSYTFKSGVMGSGLATFSKYPIQQTFFKRYILNGEPHQVFHGDWFSGKGIGACRINLPNDRILDFYNTHLHAEYDVHTNFYMVHRMCQLQELVQFVELTSRPNHAIVVVGDLNTIPESTPYELFFRKHSLSNHAPLFDTWQSAKGRRITGRIVRAKDEAPEAVESAGYTYNLPRNTYHTESYPTEKLDYVMIGGSRPVTCLDAGVLVDDRVLGSSKSLSDHCLVWAKLSIGDLNNSPVTENVDVVPIKEKLEAASQAVGIIRNEIYRVKGMIRFCHFLAAGLGGLFLAIFLAVLITFTTGVLPKGVLFGLFCVQPLILIMAVLSLFMARVWLQEQIAALIAFKREWNHFILANEPVKNVPENGRIKNTQLD